MSRLKKFLTAASGGFDRAGEAALHGVEEAETAARNAAGTIDRWRRDAPAVKAAAAGAMLLTLAVAALTADDPLASWRLWAPLPLAIFLALPALFSEPGAGSGAVPLLWTLAGFGAVTLRLLPGLLRGPLPQLAVEEAVESASFIAAGLALHLFAMRRPHFAPLVWAAALGIAFAARFFIGSGSPFFRPDLLPLGLSILWALAVFGGEMAGAPPAAGRGRGKPGPVSGWSVARNHALALAAGALTAHFAVEFARSEARSAGPKAAAAMETARQALDLAWSRSVLTGWGRGCVERVAAALALPEAAAPPSWLGLSGTLAQHGGLTAIAAAILSMALAGLALSRRNRSGLPLGGGAQLALLGAQAMLALRILGGPRSSVSLLLLAGWMALGLSSRGRRLPGFPDPLAIPRGWGRAALRAGLGGAAFVILLAAAVLSLGPVWAKALTASIRPEDFRANEPALRRALHTAGLVSPWDPAVPLAEGARLREELQRTPVNRWSEALFLRTCEAYLEAARLDPLSPMIPLELARLQKTAGRTAEAIATVERSLAYTPGSETLMDWLFLYAASEKRMDAAARMVEAGLGIAPASAKWWRRRHELDVMSGRGPAAQIALHRALTADPGDPALIAAALGRRSLLGESPAAGGEAPPPNPGDPARPEEPAG